MKKLHVYEVIIDTSGNVQKQYWLGTSKRDITSRLLEGQEMIRSKDVTDEFVISKDKVHKALTDAGFGEIEVALVMTALNTIDTTA